MTSMSLSLVCLAHLLMVQHHSCECEPLRNRDQTPEKPTTQKLEKTRELESESVESIVNRKRSRRQAIGANNLYQLQTQIMMIETR